MSEENVERVREGYERWKASRELDFGSIHPEIEWVVIDIQGRPVTYRGHHGWQKWMRAIGESWEDIWGSRPASACRKRSDPSSIGYPWPTSR